MLPLSLYIHIPWCVRKCPYCDFNSHAVRNTIPESSYIARLLADLDYDLPKVQGREIVSIFIGGGTPSLFSPKAIASLLAGIRDRLKLIDNVEITLEANPGTINRQYCEGLLQSGVNRLSIGIQSLKDAKLKALGRIHDAKEALTAANDAKAAGFTNINLDLMYGLPEQTIEEALFDLELALTLSPQHLSWYQLTLEPNTAFFYNPPLLPDDEYIWEIYEQGKAYLTKQDFFQYEISAYSHNVRQCRHNRNYWEFGDYLGIGAGAHSKITDLNDYTVKRYAKISYPNAYLNAKGNFIASEKIISLKELPLEFMMNALRLMEPISLMLFKERTGLSPNIVTSLLKQAKDNNLIVFDDNTIELTGLGRRFLNEVLTYLVP